MNTTEELNVKTVKGEFDGTPYALGSVTSGTWICAGSALFGYGSTQAEAMENWKEKLEARKNRTVTYAA